MSTDHAEMLDDQTFYIHSDFIGRIDDYRRSRPRKQSTFHKIWSVFFR